jgi:hypothetical protein
MKNKIRLSLVFTGGLLIGALSTFLLLGQVSYLQYRDYFLMTAREQIFVAWELRGNRERALQGRVESNLPHLVLALQNDKRVKSAPEAQSVLREVREFYEMNSLPIPAEISAILSNVPRNH